MSYNDKLLDERWRSKRFDILKRDYYTCQNCDNKEIPENSKRGKLKGLELVDNKVVAMLNKSDPRMRFERPKYRITFSSQEGKIVSKNVYLEGWDHEFEDSKNIVIYYSWEDDISNPDKKILIINGLKNEDKKLTDWLYVGNLHVHHKYYQKNKEPWQYPEDALTTLCWNCHSKLHQNSEVPVLNGNGENVYTLIPCKRCHGAGEFPQYKHVENGICFRCNGEKYEELI